MHRERLERRRQRHVQTDRAARAVGGNMAQRVDLVAADRGADTANGPLPREGERGACVRVAKPPHRSERPNKPATAASSTPSRLANRSGATENEVSPSIERPSNRMKLNVVTP